ncbi:isoamyl acetate-hydrolyzing esterase 1 homolog [Haemaphysalis longicornis]
MRGQDHVPPRYFMVITCPGVWVTSTTKCDVVLRGFSGYNTRVAKHVLRRVFGPENVSAAASFVVLLGTNDAAEPNDGGRTHVPLTEYGANLGEVLDYVKLVG